jgi:L-rhamnose mutarotase
MRKIYLACDLKNDPDLIELYKDYHRKGNVPDGVLASIREAGILNMEIFNTGNRLFMVMTVSEKFDSAQKAKSDAENPIVQDWEKKMDAFQQYLPHADGVKWVEMTSIFNLSDH